MIIQDDQIKLELNLLKAIRDYEFRSGHDFIDNWEIFENNPQPLKSHQPKQISQLNTRDINSINQLKLIIQARKDISE